MKYCKNKWEAEPNSVQLPVGVQMLFCKVKPSTHFFCQDSLAAILYTVYSFLAVSPTEHKEVLSLSKHVFEYPVVQGRPFHACSVRTSSNRFQRIQADRHHRFCYLVSGTCEDSRNRTPADAQVGLYTVFKTFTSP